MNSISVRIVSLSALGIGVLASVWGCASEQSSFNGIAGDGAVTQGPGAGGSLDTGGAFGSSGGSVGSTGGSTTGAGGTTTGSGGTTTGSGGTATGTGGSGNSCKPSFCPASGSGAPCCTTTGACGVDFGMGCTTTPKDAGTP